MTKLSAGELWAALDEATMDAEMERVLGLTPEERRRELREAGFDLEKVHAQADALGRTGRRPKRMRPAIAIPAAVALAAGVALAVNLASSPAPVAHPRIEPPSTPAGALRQEAREACDARGWQACLDKLNEARAIDPGGDQTPEVQSLRQLAEGEEAR
jgi:hypothetical protein